MSGEGFRPAAHFAAERRVLEREGLASWPAVAALGDGDLRRLAGDGLASEARLRRLRGQARLVQEVGVSAAEAALLLHGGIPSRQALAEADPERLLRQLGRFQRQVLGRQAPALEQRQVREWIRRARTPASRSPN